MAAQPRESRKKSRAGKKAVKKTRNRTQLSCMKKIKEMNNEQLVYGGYFVFGLYVMVLVYRYFQAVIYLEPVVISNSPILIVLFAGSPFGLWAYSTKYDVFNFHARKRKLLYLVTGSGIATAVQPVVYFANQYLIKQIMQIKIGENMTKGMVVMLGRIAVLFSLAIAILLIAVPVGNFLVSTQIKEKINVFRITHHIDERKNKEYRYDLKIIKDLETGKVRSINENDRFVHMLVNGASGTGKTSSTFIPAICNDLNQKLRNRTIRERMLFKMLQEGKCIVVAPVKDVSEYYVRPRKKYEKEYKEIYENYPDCGMTIMAPNNSLNNDIVALCEARKIPVNIIDPAKRYSEKYARRKGINPLLVDLDTDDTQRNIDITQVATAFAEVLQTTNEQNGSGDQYFRDINTSVTTNIAITIMLANCINRKYTKITEIQRCINCFGDLEPYLATIEDYYGINVQIPLAANTKKDVTADILNRNRAVSDRGSGRDNPYYETIHFVKKELLGAGREKMEDQARGLRNLINRILLDPRFKELLSADPSYTIDFSQALRLNQVTVINTGLEFGQEKSTSFGLFNMLTYDIAVKKRKKEERSDHFLWIDEASQYMHKMYDDMVTLYRQYRVAVVLAMQSLSQMEKVSTTAYLKEVIMGVGTHIVFGRVSANEMKIYSELGGLQDVDIVQKSATHSSLLEESASQNYGERVQADKRNILEGANIRIRDFQEITVFTAKEGRVLNGFVGKLRFINKKEFEPVKAYRINWNKYYKGKRREIELTKEAKSVRDEQRSILNENKGAVQIRERNLAQPMKKEKVDAAVDLLDIFNANIFEDEEIVSAEGKGDANVKPEKQDEGEQG